jgi:hypothetical protein
MRGASSSSEKNRSGNRDLGHTSATVDIRLGTRRILGRVGKSNDDESRSRKSGSERRLADDESSSRKSGSESRLANNVKMHEGRTKLKTWTSTPKFCTADHIPVAHPVSIVIQINLRIKACVPRNPVSLFNSFNWESG